MAATISVGPALLPINTVPTVRATITTVLCDASYVTGGYAVSAAQLGLGAVNFAIATAGGVQAAASTAVQWVYNLTTGKLQAFTATGEVANAVNLTNQTVLVLAFGV